jgi:[CysO sulfur-carrier protein]-S-L-cysteine hydrolase
VSRSRVDEIRSGNWSPWSRGQTGERLPRIRLTESVRNEIVEHMRQCLPNEGVGLLAAHGLLAGRVAHRYYPGRNIDASPKRYTMDPVDVAAALRDMEHRGLRLLAIVHSHPQTPPVPSKSDLAEAVVPGVLSLIIGLAPVVNLRAWQIVFDEVGMATRCEEVRIVECVSTL